MDRRTIDAEVGGGLAGPGQLGAHTSVRRLQRAVRQRGQLRWMSRANDVARVASTA